MKGKCGDTPMQEFVTFEEKNVCLLSQGKTRCYEEYC